MLTGCTTGPKPSYSDFHPTYYPVSYHIVVTIFPMYDIAKELAEKTTIDVTMLHNPGENMHTFEPSREDINLIKECDLFLCVGGESEAWVDELIKDDPGLGEKTIQFMDEIVPIGLGEAKRNWVYDPNNVDDEHAWFSIYNSVALVDSLSIKLSYLDFNEDEIISKNKELVLNKLNYLDQRYASLFAGAQDKTLIVADQFPYAYLALYYDVPYIAAYKGCNQETNVMEEDTDTLISIIREDKIPYVLYTEIGDQELADSIVQATGCKSIMLNACHTLTEEEYESEITFFDILNSNADKLEKVLGSY